jgi:hypothetical protein
MTEPSSSQEPAAPWSVSGDEAAELMRLHREQLLAFERVAEEPEAARDAPDLSLDNIPEDLRALVAEYEQARPGVTLTPLRYITIGGTDGTSVVGAAELPDEGVVSFVLTRTIADAARVDVSSRVFVAGTTPPSAESA